MPTDGSRAPRVSNPRRQDEHPLCRKRRQSSAVSRRRNHHVVSRRAPRAVSAACAPRSRHQAAQLSRQRHPERKSGSERQGSSEGSGVRGASIYSRLESRSRHAPASFETRPEEICRVDPQTKAPADHRHHFLMATRVRTYDILAVAPAVARRLHNLFSLEMWGGATFDTALRFLHEDPWSRLRDLRRLVPNVCFQMLLRGANAVGYASYPDNVIQEFVREAYKQGIDIFRVFDSLNSVENMRVSLDAILETGAVCEAAICYTGDIFDSSRPKYSLKYYVAMAKRLEKLGAHFLAIKDMAGLCRPYAAFELVRRLREEIEIPVHFHTHDTSGANAASVLKAADAGVDVADAAVASMSGGTSQPNLNAIVAALQNTPRDTLLDLEALNECSDYWETVRTYYAPFDSGPKAGSSRLYEHEIPGGQFTNLREQAASMGLGHRWREVERTYAEVNQLFGDIVKVTPSSKVVGDMTLFLMAKGMRPEDVLKLDAHHDVAFPNSVIEMFSGVLGVPPGGWPKKLQKIILRDAQPLRGRPGAKLPPVDFAAETESLRHKTGRPVALDDLLSYLLYPE